MKKTVTILLNSLVLLAITTVAYAQPQQVTLSEINAIAQENIDQLNAAGTDLQSADITALIGNDLIGSGTEIQFVAVVMSDPRSSGLAGVNGETGLPDRLHVFVRDTSAVSSGVEGMGIQVVDGSYTSTGLDAVTVGDVIKFTGTAAFFSGAGGNSLQFSPTTVELLGSLADNGLPETLLDPVVVTSADIVKSIDDQGNIQVNWDNLSIYNNQYVKVENATLIRRDISSTRPNWLISTDGGTTSISFYDTSLRYRNDRSNYPDDYNKLSDDFVPPPPGTLLNLSGFLTYQGDDPFGISIPSGALLSLNPMADSDLEILESPPIITNVMGPDFIPDGSAPVAITFNASADETRSLSTVSCLYSTSEDATEMTVAATDNGDGTYTCEIPAQGDAVFVTYMVSATDNTDATSMSDAASYRTLVNGIGGIAHIQETADGGPGDSPFSGLAITDVITATVQTNFGVSGIGVIQDDETLAPWSGVLIDYGDAEAPAQGDQIRIESYTIDENFGVTTLEDVTFSVIGNAGTFDYKTVPTDVLVDENTAEAHEGMMVRFENVIITNNDAGFGEWAFSSDGTEDNEVLADDASAGVAGDYAASTFGNGDAISFIQGIWWYSFGNYKLVPEDPATDVGEVTNVSVEEDELPGQYRLDQNYPNPFNPVTTINYQVAKTGQVSIEVFDLLGRKVQTLVDDVLAAGSYEVTFNASNLSSGMYVYRLKAGDIVKTQQMVLMK